jgi:hypothetical protein
MTRHSTLWLAALILMCAVPAHAQQAPVTFGIGYAASVPSQFVGVSGHVLFPILGAPTGLYVDLKFGPSTPEGDPFFVAGMTHEDATGLGDQWFRDELYWRNVNVALMRRFTGELMLYGGMGYARREAFSQYYDPTIPPERGDGGWYWIADPDNDLDTVNFLGGAFFRVGRGLWVQLGAESAPRGFTVGATLSFPRT